MVDETAKGEDVSTPIENQISDSKKTFASKFSGLSESL